MIGIKEIQLLSNTPRITHAHVQTLYTISKSSLGLLLLLSSTMSYVFFEASGGKVLLWYGLFLLVILHRLYSSNTFRTKNKKYPLKKWYLTFIFESLLTSAFFAFFGIMVILYDSTEAHHLFIMATLLALTSGANNAFVVDHRLSILYTSMIVLPLLIAMIFHGGNIHLTSSFILLVFLGRKAILTIHHIEQEEIIQKQRAQIQKSKDALDEKEILLHNFFQTAPLAIFSYDMDLRILDANETLATVLGSKKKMILGFDITSLPDKRPLSAMQKALTSGNQIYRGPYVSLYGKEFWIELICFPFKDNQGQTEGAIAIVNDKTKEHRAISELEYNATHDHLTSLLNRRGFKSQMEAYFQKEKHTTHYSVLSYLDLDKFKEINDSLGHATGDKLLISVAEKLKNVRDKECLISRVGGDEFIILSPFITAELQELQPHISQCIRQIKEVFSEPFSLGSSMLSIRASIGIVIIEPSSMDINEIIRRADIAMYQSKNDPHRKVAYYDKGLDRAQKMRFLLQNDLANAISKDQLKLYLQPLVSISDDTLKAAECLIRWEHPSHGILSPQEFIPMAIEIGAIPRITWWIIEEVCREVSLLKERDQWRLQYISVNIDAKQLLIEDFTPELLTILSRYAMQPNELMLEITEQSIIDNFEATQETISTLKQEGILCAIDDFGIGYSSLSYLKKLSFDTLKIDKTFIHNIKEKPDDVVLIASMLSIGRQFGYNIVVEGVEEESQRGMLKSIDSELLYQGYLFEKPMPFDAFTEKYFLT